MERCANFAEALKSFEVSETMTTEADCGQIERLRSIQLGFHSQLSYVMVPKEALRVLRMPPDCCHRAAVYFA
ncbi:hypothetical protein WJX75_004517 [Coccomyxa subellipsoidea]|uniref:Uncharacterized protein n=1 Tax=Coccomyxa subellipsoidea TaxID=248742 RepID=A0ABR2YCK6_9CHLO